MVPAHFLRLVGPPSCVLPAPDILQQVPRLLPLRPPSRRRIRVAEGGRCRGQYVFDPKLSVTSSLLHAARFPLLQETELMPPRLALHAGADRRVAEVQLELLACAGVTWSRVETRGMYVGRGDSRPHKLDPRCTSAWQRLLAQGIFLGSPQQTVFQNLQLSQAL